jgi:hypothetical protein
MMVVALVHAHLRVPAVALYLSKELIILHHSSAAGLVMLQMNETSVAEFLAPAREMLRKYMRVYVNLE